MVVLGVMAPEKIAPIHKLSVTKTRLHVTRARESDRTIGTPCNVRDICRKIRTNISDPDKGNKHKLHIEGQFNILARDRGRIILQSPGLCPRFLAN